MGKALQIINGIARQAEVSAIVTIYDETITVGEGGLPEFSTLTLPDSGNYKSLELRVFVNGQFLGADVDYEYVGNGGTRTQVLMYEALNQSDKVRFRINKSADPLVIYDQTLVIGQGGISAGTNITLPNGAEYNDVELEVYLDGQFLEPTIDYNYVGVTPPRTQIQLTFDVLQNERLRFRFGD
jgi:hypothetical protein